MIIIDPAVEFITERDPLKRIELCGRVCYKSEDRITEDSAKRFVESLIKRGHTSVLEHARVVITQGEYKRLLEAARFRAAPHIRGALARVSYHDQTLTPAINIRDFIKSCGKLKDAVKRDMSDDYMTVRFTCDRAIANELVRHRVFSFSQESTRYVNYAGREMGFIRPLPFPWAEYEDNMRYALWWNTCLIAAEQYQSLIDGYGCTPQEARNVLPLSLKTELIMTGTYNQWHDMLKLRLDTQSHPQMRYLMELMVNHAECPEEIANKWRNK